MVDCVRPKSLRHPSPLGNGCSAPLEKPGGHGTVCHGRHVLSGGCRERGGPAFPASAASLHLWAWLQGHRLTCLCLLLAPPQPNVRSPPIFGKAFGEVSR